MPKLYSQKKKKNIQAALNWHSYFMSMQYIINLLLITILITPEY